MNIVQAPGFFTTTRRTLIVIWETRAGGDLGVVALTESAVAQDASMDARNIFQGVSRQGALGMGKLWRSVATFTGGPLGVGVRSDVVTLVGLRVFWIDFGGDAVGVDGGGSQNDAGCEAASVRAGGVVDNLHVWTNVHLGVDASVL